MFINSYWLIRSSETMVLANPDVVNEFYEHPTNYLKAC